MAAGDFIYTDPVAAQQAVRLAEIEAQAKASQGRDLAQIASTAIQAGGREKDRQLTRELSKDQLQAQKEIEGTRQKIATDRTIDYDTRQRATAEFDGILAQISGGDPPTAGELDVLLSRSQSLRPEQQDQLRAYRKVQVGNLGQQFQSQKMRADAWNAKLSARDAKGNPPAQFNLDKIHEQAGKDRNVQFNPATSLYEPVTRPPRQDATPGGGLGGVEDINALRRRMGAAGAAAPTGPAPQGEGFLAPTMSNILGRTVMGPALEQAVTGAITGLGRSMFPSAQRVAPITAPARPVAVPRLGDINIPTGESAFAGPMTERDLGFIGTEAGPRVIPYPSPRYYDLLGTPLR